VTREDTLLDLLESHGAAVRRIARAYAGADEEEEDLYQEILMQLWRGLPSFRGESTPGTWLYRVALNTALTWRRRAANHAAGFRKAKAATRAAAGTIGGSSRSEAAILSDFLETLSGPDHSVILLYMEGLSYREIADVTGLGVSAVGVRLHRMKQAFTQRYVEG
jgi:RNA polymerase sigma-70 factor, ECF subfamily